MKNTILVWIIAFALTIFSAIYQRMTGPTYPVNSKGTIAGKSVSAKFDRAHGGTDDNIVKVSTQDNSISGVLFWKRYKTNDEYTKVEMKYENGLLLGNLPNQPPAGKLQYHVELKKDIETVFLPADKNVVIRFRGAVPLWVMIPHVLLIFTAMFLSTRTGLEFFREKTNLIKLTNWTLFFIGVGGMICGPIVQKYAFGEFWTGFPFGHDLTDNKTLIAFIAWLLAFWAVRKFKNPKRWVLGAAITTFIIFIIPHSVLGSELDYNKLDQQKKTEQIENVNKK